MSRSRRSAPRSISAAAAKAPNSLGFSHEPARVSRTASAAVDREHAGIELQARPIRRDAHTPSGHLAAALEAGEHGALRFDGGLRLPMIQLPNSGGKFVSRSHFDANGALPGGGQTDRGRQKFADRGRRGPTFRGRPWPARSRRNLLAPASPGACPRFRASRPLRDRRDGGATAPGGASCWCPRARRAAIASSLRPPREMSASRASSRSQIAAISSPGGRAR